MNIMLSSAEIYPTLPVTDLARSRKFYEGKLGLEVENDSIGGIILYKTGAGTKLMTFTRPPTKADHSVASFVVDDIKQAVDELKSKGIVFEQYDMGNGIKTDEDGILAVGDAKAAWFKDTEGNILALNQKT